MRIFSWDCSLIFHDTSKVVVMFIKLTAQSLKNRSFTGLFRVGRLKSLTCLPAKLNFEKGFRLKFNTHNKIPLFSSKRGHVTEKHVLTGRKHDMLGNQTLEVRRPLSKLSHQSWKPFDVFDKQILPKLQTRYSSVQGFQK